eukprot:7746137-Lingulodinium_polyedra.AAC.1
MTIVMLAAREAMTAQRRAPVDAILQKAAQEGLGAGIARRAIENWTAIDAWKQCHDEIEFAPRTALADVHQVLARARGKTRPGSAGPRPIVL